MILTNKYNMLPATETDCANFELVIVASPNTKTESHEISLELLNMEKVVKISYYIENDEPVDLKSKKTKISNRPIKLLTNGALICCSVIKLRSFSGARSSVKVKYIFYY